MLGSVKIIADTAQVPDIGTMTLCSLVRIPVEAF